MCQDRLGCVGPVVQLHCGLNGTGGGDLVLPATTMIGDRFA
jgi:hypothetical protein